MEYEHSLKVLTKTKAIFFFPNIKYPLGDNFINIDDILGTLKHIFEQSNVMQGKHMTNTAAEKKM